MPVLMSTLMKPILTLSGKASKVKSAQEYTKKLEKPKMTNMPCKPTIILQHPTDYSASGLNPVVVKSHDSRYGAWRSPCKVSL